MKKETCSHHISFDPTQKTKDCFFLGNILLFFYVISYISFIQTNITEEEEEEEGLHGRQSHYPEVPRSPPCTFFHPRRSRRVKERRVLVVVVYIMSWIANHNSFPLHIVRWNLGIARLILFKRLTFNKSPVLVSSPPFPPCSCVFHCFFAVSLITQSLSPVPAAHHSTNPQSKSKGYYCPQWGFFWVGGAEEEEKEGFGEGSGLFFMKEGGEEGSRGLLYYCYKSQMQFQWVPLSPPHPWFLLSKCVYLARVTKNKIKSHVL